MSELPKSGPSLTIDPKLRAHFSEIDFDMVRFTNSLETIGVHGDVVETLQVSLKNTDPPYYQRDMNYYLNGEQRTAGGEYRITTNTISLYPRSIVWILGKMRRQDIENNPWLNLNPWLNRDDQLSSLHNRILAHEAKHAEDLTSAKGIQGYTRRVERGQTFRAYTNRAAIAGAFGGDIVSELTKLPLIETSAIGFLSAGIIGFMGRSAYLTVKEKDQRPERYDVEAAPSDFEHSQQALELFQGIISIKSK